MSSNARDENAREMDRLLALGATTAAPVHLEGFAPFALVPSGYFLQGLESYRLSPPFIKETVICSTVESFIAYVRRFQDKAPESSALAFQFGRTDKPGQPVMQVDCFLDWHQPARPANGFHRVVFKPDFESSWLAWLSKDRKYLDQAAFGEHCEEFGADIEEPNAATIREVVLEVTGTQTKEWSSGVRLRDGGWQLKSVDRTSTSVKGRDVEIFDHMRLVLPVFVGAPAVELHADVRYQIKDGKLQLAYFLRRPEAAVKKSWDAWCAAIQQALPGTLTIDGSLRRG